MVIATGGSRGLGRAAAGAGAPTGRASRWASCCWAAGCWASSRWASCWWAAGCWVAGCWASCLVACCGLGSRACRRRRPLPGPRLIAGSHPRRLERVSIYLDHAATTPLRPEAFEAMRPWLTGAFGNPSGGHRVAREARRAVDEARDAVAVALGCRPGEVVFTSGGTEADNLAVAGVIAAARERGGPAGVVCSAVEHHAVLHSVEALGGHTVGVDAAGRIDLTELAETIGADTALVSVMLANNEVGTIEDLDAVAATIAERAPGALLHTDAVQAVAWLDVATLAAPAALVSVAAHKFGGPQGVGALVVRDGVRLTPILRGGGQEREHRSGTHNVAGIVGMAAALTAAVADRDGAVAAVRRRRDRLVAGVAGQLDGVVESAAGVDRLPNIAHLRLAGVDNEALLVLLDDAEVCASAGSSCASGAMEPSHVLAAMGVSRDEARTALRLSLGRTTTDADVDQGIEAVVSASRRLRAPVGAPC
jgi:cysteine desulfurase